MNLMKLTVASLVAAVLLVGCGGGGKDAGTSPFGAGPGGGTGGSAGGGTTTAASLTLDLLNATSASTRITQGGQNYTLTVALKDASGNAVPSTTVTVSATDFTLTPASGKKLTSTPSGVASLALTQIDPSASSATQICATATINRRLPLPSSSQALAMPGSPSVWECIVRAISRPITPSTP